MLAEFVSAITGLQEKASTVSVTELGYQTIVAQGGTHQILDTPQKYPSYRWGVETLDDLVRMSVDMKDTVDQSNKKRFGEDHEPGTTMIMVGREAIIAFIDSANQADTVVLPLVRAPQFERLAGLSKHGGLNQKVAIRTIRVDLHGTDAGKHEESFRGVRFKTSMTSGGTIKAESESLGREVLQEIQADTKIPEIMEITTPVFSNMDLIDSVQTVKVVVTVDFEQERILMDTPLSEITAAIDRMRTIAFNRLVEETDDLENIGVYYS